MNKTPMPQSPGSAASSETSETQSISDEPIIYSSVRSTKKSNRDSEKERPPWRPVSVAAPSKADKNALLKAKLLDATRRALIFQKIANVSTQTDVVQTKLLRDASVDVQIDLILQQDESVETDGAITIRQENLGGFIMTQTVGQMTEGVMLSDVATQTAQPKTNLAFSRFLCKDNYSATNTIVSANLDEVIRNNEIKLRAQIAELKQLDINDQPQPRQTQPIQKLTQSEDSLSSVHSEVSTAENNDSDENIIYVQPSKGRKASKSRNFLAEPTLTSWENFDLTDDEDGDGYERPCLPRRTMSEAAKAPWSDYREMLIGQRLANMRLSPLPPKRSTVKKKTVSWSDAQERAVAELISEASAMMDAFDQVSLLLGPDLQLNESTDVTVDTTATAMPQSKWDPILTQSCQNLADELNKFKPHDFRVIY